MSDFGAKLRAARERSGVSLRDIADQTKLSIAALESLEKNDLSRIPGGIFARSLVRSYASEVGLDPEATVREFVARFNVEPPPSFTAELSAEAAANEPSHRGLTTLLKIVVASLVAVAILFYLTRVRQAEQWSTTPAPDARRTSRRVVSVVPTGSRP